MFVKHIQLGCYGCDMLWLLPILSPHDNARRVLSPRILCGLLWQCVIALQAHGQCHGQCPEEMFGPLTMGTAKVPWRSLARHPDATASESLECTIIWFDLICLHLILFVSRFQHAIWSDWTDVNRFFDFSLAGLPEANTFGRSEANNCRAKATQSGRRGFSFRIVFDRFWLVRLKPSHHVCHAIVHLWKIAIPDPNLLKLTHASDGAAEHPVRIQLFTHTGC